MLYRVSHSGLFDTCNALRTVLTRINYPTAFPQSVIRFTTNKAEAAKFNSLPAQADGMRLKADAYFFSRGLLSPFTPGRRCVTAATIWTEEIFRLMTILSMPSIFTEAARYEETTTLRQRWSLVCDDDAVQIYLSPTYYLKWHFTAYINVLKSNVQH